MNVQEYSRIAYQFVLESVRDDELYFCLGLISEFGEVADKVKKQIRDNGDIFTDEFRNNIAYELGDCFWYINSICRISKLEFSVKPFTIVFGDCQKIGRIIVETSKLLNFELAPSKDLINQEYIDGIIENLCEICHIIEIPVSLILQRNIDKLCQRKKTNKLSGSGDYR